MGLRDLNLEESYETEENKTHLLDSFYVPVLEQAEKYYRIAGFFSSTALTVAAQGIAGLIQNQGKMYLLISPQLSRSDYKVIKEHGELREADSIFQDLDFSGGVSENVQALAWLLDQGLLEIKFVIGTQSENSLFHQKVGIITDRNKDQISFSGSINESAQGWLNNIEEFKVFCSWRSGQQGYINSDFSKFLSYWKNERPQIATVYSLPEAVKQKIIQVKPDNIMDLSIMKKYRKGRVGVSGKINGLSLFPHQQKAVQKWRENNYSLLMEMATGTGKTRTAIGCMLKKLEDKEKLLVIVATPQNTLSRQWMDDFKKLNIHLDRQYIIDGSNLQWKHDLKMLLFAFDAEIRQAVIFTTHSLSSSQKFIDLIMKYKGNIKILFICDEVHAIGASKQRNALLPCYDYRIGLSATPERLYDEEGSQLIRDYFGNASFEFTIEDALSTVNPLTNKPFLNPFKYFVHFVDLNENESKKLKKYNKDIARLNQEIEEKKKASLSFEKEKEQLERVYLRRANIVKNAEGKLDALRQLLDQMGSGEIQDMIIFASDKQIEPFMRILADRQITRAKITEEESAKKIRRYSGLTERQQIIDDFAQHRTQVLLGIKCLDEGIDITSARIAVLMANSTNPREYIQRIGRVIRPGKDKKESEIFDYFIWQQEGKTALPSELKRAAFIAENAMNREDVYRKFEELGVDLHEYQQENQGTN